MGESVVRFQPGRTWSSSSLEGAGDRRVPETCPFAPPLYIDQAPTKLTSRPRWKILCEERSSSTRSPTSSLSSKIAVCCCPLLLSSTGRWLSRRCLPPCCLLAHPPPQQQCHAHPRASIQTQPHAPPFYAAQALERATDTSVLQAPGTILPSVTATT